MIDGRYYKVSYWKDYWFFWSAEKRDRFSSLHAALAFYEERKAIHGKKHYRDAQPWQAPELALVQVDRLHPKDLMFKLNKAIDHVFSEYKE